MDELKIKEKITGEEKIKKRKKRKSEWEINNRLFAGLPMKTERSSLIKTV